LGEGGLELFYAFGRDDVGIRKMAWSSSELMLNAGKETPILATFLLNVVFTLAFAIPILSLNRPMRNIFLLYMPPGNTEAMVHYQDTIRNKIEFDKVAPHLTSGLSRKLQQIFGPHRIAVWGSRDSAANRSKFDRMKEGDEILIVEGETIRLLGRVAAKVISPSLSAELWKNLRGNTREGWNLIYFIANPREINLPFAKFCALLGFKENFQLRGFTSIAKERLEAFYSQYDDLYSILLRVKNGDRVQELPEPEAYKQPPVRDEELLEPPERELSDHLRMQWLLLKMGRQAGEKVWAPKNDQQRIISEYKFGDFEETFAAGLDTQVKYVENIDVVWKEEFRIDAAFEIENSTSIYSGLLRFADLTMVAPNTLYPMFIVAPSERRNRVREQLARPSFRHLGIHEKVRYLSYEKVKEIDEFSMRQRAVSTSTFLSAIPKCYGIDGRGREMASPSMYSTAGCHSAMHFAAFLGPANGT
jgi:hypothetical protein